MQTAAKVASVIGRSFPVALLRETYPIEEVRSRVEDYLRVLEEERLIQREAEDCYSFSHALVEEAVYERLLFVHRKSLHGVVAEALLRSHGHDPGPVAQLLGHHLSKAGRNHEAGHFLGMAGMRAVRHGAYREGLAFLDRAILLRPPCAERAEECVNQARWRRLRAESLLGLGRLAESGEGFRDAAEAMGVPAPAGNLTGYIVRQAVRRLWRGLKKPPVAAAGSLRGERLRELAACYEMLSILDLFSNRMSSSLAAAMESLHHAECLGCSEEHARALAAMALASSLVPARFLADRYARRALKTAKRPGMEMTRSRVLELVGMYYLGDGRWPETERSLREAIAGFQVVGDRRREIECTCLLSVFYHYRGDFVKRVELGREVSRLACVSGDLQAQAWGLLDQIESWLNLGDFERARLLGEELRRHIGQNIYGADEIMAHGLLAALDLRAGDYRSAAASADKALEVMKRVSPTIVYNMEAYGAVAEVYLAGWANEALPAAERAVLRDRAREAARCVRGFSRVFRIGVPRSFLVTAREEELQGNSRRACRLTVKSLAAAPGIFRQLSAACDVSTILTMQRAAPGLKEGKS